ncbi:MAG: hypothetical protein KKE44_20355 [Proteobacteria bacterium]|nr:hypothetical protein [Pseudomonadota bacterium]MBU1585085.1 hypothetical protein [Pseudomonadota bacterium]
MDKIIEIFYMLVFYVFLFWIVRLHIKTRIKIKNWALKNDFTILKTSFFPWYHYGFIVAGIHPASFRVTVKDNFGHEKRYSIAGGGSFWLRDEIDVKTLKV